VNPQIQVVTRILRMINEYYEQGLLGDLSVLHDVTKALLSILGSEALLKVSLYFIREKATTAYILRQKLGIPKSTVYWALERLHQLGLIKPTTTFRETDIKKKPVTVWALYNAPPEASAKAITLHMRLSNPKYRVAEELGDRLAEELEAIGRRDITYKEVLNHVREYGSKYSTLDVADIVSYKLSEKGFRVWR